MTDNQKTIKSAITLEGIGLHTGVKTTLSILPAPANHGYKFQRMDLEGQPMIDADVSRVTETQRGTTLEQNGEKIHTTEHCLAGIYSTGIDNAIIQVDGPEIPIMDGSARMFIDAIEKAGIEDQDKQRDYFIIKDTIKFEVADKGIEFLAVPDENYRITVMVDYGSPALGTQHASMMKLANFKEEISTCRTFVFLRELEYLASNGLIKGGDLNNAIVLVERENISEEEITKLRTLLGKEDLEIKLDGIGVLNTTKLRFPNEPARHKLLDIVGDLALVGRRIKGHILSARPGHYGNTEFGKLLKAKMLEEKNDKRKHFDLTKDPLFDINDISNMIPHRYPFLLIDKIMEISDNGIVGVKNVTLNEPFFQGHFPGNPVMPGVLQIEAMAQTGGVFALNQVEDPENYSTYFLKIDNVRYKKKVMPGDTIVFDLELISPIRRGLVNMKGKAYVNGVVVSEAEMLAQIVKEKNS